MAINIFRGKSFPVLEPAVLLLLFALSLSDTVFQNQVVYQVCTAVYKYNSTECSLLGTAQATNDSKEIETEVQPYAVDIFMVRTMLENVVPAFGVLFIGPWSDKFGRKPLIMAALIGFILKFAICAALVFISNKVLINPWFYLIATIPEVIVGGQSSLAVGCICFLTDITSPNERMIRMAIYEACIYLGLLTGSLCSSYLFLATNSFTTFSVTGLIILFLVIYISMFLKESLETSTQQKGTNVFHLFDIALVKDVFQSCFKQRPYCARMIILIVLTVMGLHTISIGGTGTVFYLFVREKFSWTIQDATTYDAISIGVQIVGDLLGMLLFRKILKFSAEALGAIAYFSGVLDTIIKGLASLSWHIYLSVCVGLLKGVGAAMCNTILASIATSGDVGKLISLSRALRSFSIMASAPLYSTLYNMTLTSFPSAFNFLNTTLLSICLVLLLVVLCIKKSFSNIYNELS